MILDADAEGWPPEETAAKIIEIDPVLADIIVLGTNPSASSTPKMSGVHILVDELKAAAPDLKVVLGGMHPSALPERTMEEEKADFVCKEEGFYTILQLLEVLTSGGDPSEIKIPGLWYRKDNGVFSNEPVPFEDDLDTLPQAAWDLLPMDKYRAHNWHCFNDLTKRNPYAVIYTSLGCPFRCSYCPVQAFYGKPKLPFRSPENVIEEIDLLVKKYNVKNIKIMDELFVYKEDRVQRICDLLIERGYDLNIWVYARVDTIKESMLSKMKKAGINWIAYGIESANAVVRKGVNKTLNEERIRQAVDMTHAAGIHIIGNFIFGLPDDNMETMRETLSLAKNFDLEYVNFYICMAYPGSELYDEALKSGVKMPDEWHGFGQYSYESLPLPTKHLEPSQIIKFRDNAFKDYFSDPVYLDSIRRKFGEKVVTHIKDMLKKELKRKYC